jgi:hypothetical protein
MSVRRVIRRLAAFLRRDEFWMELANFLERFGC